MAKDGRFFGRRNCGCPFACVCCEPVMKYVLKASFLWLVWLALTCSMSASAAINMMGSRVIYEESRGETVVQLRQTGDTAGLVQVWLDTGDDSLDAHMQETPFLITPSVARMDPHSGQSIRILRVGDGLPQDRETLFFFNVLEVPPKPTAHIEAGKNFLQFSSRMRLKFFYRPKGLTPRPDEVYQLLRFSLPTEKNSLGDAQVRIYNPTPYHVVFKTLALRGGADRDAPVLAELSTETVGVLHTTVPPMGELLLPLVATSGLESLNAPGVQVAFEVVGDLGNFIQGQRGLD